MPYDLEDRTARFAESVIDLVKSIKINSINQRIVSQIVGSAGSIGANYCEANESESKKDFVHKIKIATKEIKETRHWLRLLLRTESCKAKEIDKLTCENTELLMIFSKIIKNCNREDE
jgi:four helix bundle protein